MKQLQEREAQGRRGTGQQADLPAGQPHPEAQRAARWTLPGDNGGQRLKVGGTPNSQVAQDTKTHRPGHGAVSAPRDGRSGPPWSLGRQRPWACGQRCFVSGVTLSPPQAPMAGSVPGAQQGRPVTITRTRLHGSDQQPGPRASPSAGILPALHWACLPKAPAAPSPSSRGALPGVRAVRGAGDSDAATSKPQEAASPGQRPWNVTSPQAERSGQSGEHRQGPKGMRASEGRLSASRRHRGSRQRPEDRRK